MVEETENKLKKEELISFAERMKMLGATTFRLGADGTLEVCFLPAAVAQASISAPGKNTSLTIEKSVDPNDLSEEQKKRLFYSSR